MNERQTSAAYENENRTDGKWVPLTNPLSISCAEDRRGRRERLKSDRVMRKGLLKSRLLRYKSNEIRMNGLSFGAVAPFSLFSVRNEQSGGLQSQRSGSPGAKFYVICFKSWIK